MQELDDVEVKALRGVLGTLSSLDPARRSLVLEFVRVFDKLGPAPAAAPTVATTGMTVAPAHRGPGRPSGSATAKRGPGRPPGRPVTKSATVAAPAGASTDAAARKFVAEKAPNGALQTVAVLGYYLEKMKNMPVYQNSDITKLNAAVGGTPFSNVHVTVNNAIVRGLVARGKNGLRKLSPAGIAFVEALPDHSRALEAVRAVLRGGGAKSASKPAGSKGPGRPKKTPF